MPPPPIPPHNPFEGLVIQPIKPPRFPEFARFLRESGIITPAPAKPRTFVERLYDHDVYPEGRHYLFGEQSTRLAAAWSVTWLTWGIGVGATHSPYARDEHWAAWVNLGPLTVEIFTPPSLP